MITIDAKGNETMSDDMNAVNLPTTLEKRELLYGKGADPATLSAHGDAYLRAGKPDEAVHFFHKIADWTRLEKLAGTALEEGDFFTFSLARKLLGKPPGADEWTRLARMARQAGKEAFARRAEGEAENITSPPKK